MLLRGISIRSRLTYLCFLRSKGVLWFRIHWIPVFFILGKYCFTTIRRDFVIFVIVSLFELEIDTTYNMILCYKMRVQGEVLNLYPILVVFCTIKICSNQNMLPTKSSVSRFCSKIEETCILTINAIFINK